MYIVRLALGLIVSTVLIQDGAVQAGQSWRGHKTAVLDGQDGLLAQAEELPNPGTSQPFEEPPSRRPLQEDVPRLPPPEILLQFPEPPDTSRPTPELGGDRICVTGFNITGSTVYSVEELAQVAADAIPLETPNCEVANPDPTSGYLLTFAQLQQARDAITQYYVSNQYITTGAFIPEQTLGDGVVQLQVLEGRVEEIQVLGLDRLNPAYVRDRIALAAQPPLNTEKLLQGLQLLQLDPLIETLNVELAAGIRPGTNRLVVSATEANPYRLGFALDNGRTPLVGSFQRQVQGGHINLLGQGDRFFVDYANTNGSNSVNLSYTYPLNARNGTLSFSHGRTSSWVIEDPFGVLDIRSRSRYYELTYRQPIYQTPNQEFALSLTGSREESESRFNPGGFGDQPFPVRGSDQQGRTRITALRFTQEWLDRDSRQVLALRSQFSLGINALGVTLNATPPDANFFSWRTQGQWVRLLGPDTLLQLRGEVQLADRPLAPLEQIGLGGIGTVRGYRQDQLLTDNGIMASADVRFPIARVPEVNGLLQIIPFVDFGLGWNETGENPNPNTLLSTGLGLNWQMAGGFSTRLDYGVPLLNTPSTGNSLQEAGLVFSLRYEPL
ncbi:MAG TPA: ShlB/FhaC/HecB family hemolysin secretion/activation protein [Leptolyngbyaceae cyanobacterium]